MESGARAHAVSAEDLVRWATTADELDEVDASTSLWAAVGFAGVRPGDVGVAFTRASNFLLQGRAGEAAQVMRRLPHRRGEHIAVDAARDATAAAMGDDEAWVSLLNHVARHPRVDLLYLLAGSAECRGDRVTADDAWLALRDQFGRSTGLVLSRAAVAEISRATLSSDPDARVRAIADSAYLLGLAGGPGWADTRWALDAVAGLEARGDTSGARLLALALRYAVAQPPRVIVDELARRTPRAVMRSFGLWAVGSIVTGVAVLWLSPSPFGWLLFALAARELLNRCVRVPGMSAQDSRAWRALRLRSLSTGHGPDPVLLPRWAAISTYAVTAALGGVVAAAVTDLRFGGPRSLIWFVAVVALPLTAMLLAQARHRSQGIGQARREAAVQGRDAQMNAARCRCWNHDVLRHDAARLYLREHLAPVDLSAGEGSLLAVSTYATWVGRCPDSHIRWLTWQTTREGGLLAVRGAPTGGVTRSVATS